MNVASRICIKRLFRVGEILGEKLGDGMGVLCGLGAFMDGRWDK